MIPGLGSDIKYNVYYNHLPKANVVFYFQDSTKDLFNGNWLSSWLK